MKYRYLIARRITQLGILLLYIAGNVYGIKILQGNLSASMLFDTIPLSDPYAVLQMFVAGSVMGVNLLIGAAIIVLLYGVIGGRAFCSWVCPINLVTDAANYLRRKLGFAQVQKRVYMARSLRYWVLAISLILSFVLGVAAFEMISPISMMHRGIVFGIGLGFAPIVAIFLFDLLVHEHAWCGYICPLGAFYALTTRFSLIRVRHNAQNCTACMGCKEVCPEKDVLHMIDKSSESVLMGECTNCARCIEVCNDDALGFSIRSNLKVPKEANTKEREDDES